MSRDYDRPTMAEAVGEAPDRGLSFVPGVDFDPDDEDDLADLNPGTASGLASKMEQDGLLLAEGRPKRYTLAPESAPAKPKPKPIAWDPPRAARAWESVLGLKLSHVDVRLALDIAQRASTRRNGS